MNTGNSLLCFMAGALAGAVAAVLLAPDSGQNTRAKIRKSVSDVADRTRGRIEEGLDVIEKALEEK